MNFDRNSSAYMSGIMCMFFCVLTVEFQNLQVYILIYWGGCGSRYYLLFWLYRSCNTELMLLDLCILITRLIFFKVAMMMLHKYLAAS